MADKGNTATMYQLILFICRAYHKPGDSVPQTPWDFSLYASSGKGKQADHGSIRVLVLAVASLQIGAQVASLQSPILRWSTRTLTDTSNEKIPLEQKSGFVRTSGFANYKVSGFADTPSGFANYICPVLLAPRQPVQVLAGAPCQASHVLPLRTPSFRVNKVFFQGIRMKEMDVDTDKQEGAAEPLAPLDPSSITADQLHELNQRAAKADDHWERLLRTTADLENYKKRAAREKQDAIKFANESLIEKLIPILDNFDMALSATQNAGGKNETVQSLQAGVQMIFQQLKTALKDAGLEEINAQGQSFDPNLHEAISQQESAEVPEGNVVQQLRKGYKLRERLLRPASVVVAKRKA
jgi:molecular chaperone GrpE